MRTVKQFALIALAAVVGFSANAALIPVTFGGPSAVLGHEVVFTEGALEVTVSAWYSPDGSLPGIDDNVTRANVGLGTGVGVAPIDNTVHVAQWLSFSTNMGTITQVVVSGIGGSVEGFMFGASADNDGLINSVIFGAADAPAVDVPAALAAAPFLWVGTASDFDLTKFLVRKIVVDTPEPATLGMMGAALLGLGLLRRRRLAA